MNENDNEMREGVGSASVGPPRDFETVTDPGHHASREKEWSETKKKFLGKTIGAWRTKAIELGIGGCGSPARN